MGLPGAFFLGMAEGKGVAPGKLRGLCAWLGMTDDKLRAYEPHPGAHAYAAFLAWLALNGSRADVVLAFLAMWAENCGKVAAALREAYRAGDAAVAFFDFFASPPTDFEARVGGPGRGTLAFAPVSPNSLEEDWLARQAKPRLPGFEYRGSRSKPGSRS